ncbi:MAG TPA: hypothetical protein VH120_00905 [Gemmataceae bacterium]|nr:hypothetical protein [Gemmataceae bacterium]
MQKLAAEFIPAADASDRIQSKSCTDDDSLLFQKFGGHRTVPSVRACDGLGQGQYAVTPSGELLASSASANPKEVATMMRDGLVKWAKMPKEKRLLEKVPDPAAADRWRKYDRLYPADGLVLRSVCRDLPRDDIPEHLRGAWNQDFAWFRKTEARSFLPSDPAVGAKQEVSRRLIERLARFNLTDSVRALNYNYFAQDAVERADLTSTVTGRNGERVELRFEGTTRCAKADPDGYGYEARLLGKATFDLKANRFTAFELVAVGPRWGKGNCNLRHDDPGPAAMGVVFTLADDTPADRIPPAHVGRYDW